MFSDASITLCSNDLFSCETIPAMNEKLRHPSMERLLSAAAELGISGPAALAKAMNESDQTVTNWSKRGVSKSGAIKAQEIFGVSPAQIISGEDQPFHSQVTATAPAPHPSPTEDEGPPDLVITQYEETGGGMGRGFNLTDNPPGHIRSWQVSHDWLRINVPSHTGVRNLAIVTGFGSSMKPMFNPGDPLLVDTGVKVINHEGVYFFRVGDEGFIKLIQRVPEFDGPGIILRVISKNPDFPPYDLSPKNQHFEVLGKVLTVWRSEQY